MTVGFYSYNKEHGIILTQIVPNTSINRRLFWYYWPRNTGERIDAKYFNQRWSTLAKIYLRNISCELIGILIESWLRIDNHAVYDSLHNNGQHFVRDLVSALDINVAKEVSARFDGRSILSEAIEAEACDAMHIKLWPILEDYKTKKIKVEAEENIDEEDENDDMHEDDEKAVDDIEPKSSQIEVIHDIKHQGNDQDDVDGLCHVKPPDYRSVLKDLLSNGPKVGVCDGQCGSKLAMLIDYAIRTVNFLYLSLLCVMVCV